MNWLQKKAGSDIVRVERNIRRLEHMRAKVHDLGYFVMSSNSGGYLYLKELLQDKLVLGRPKLQAKLTEALVGENNQKIALDSPLRFQQIMREAEQIIDREIRKEKKQLKELGAVDGQFSKQD
jgi:hypothetical protein